MVQIAFKSCRVCGGDIEPDAETCHLCSSRQRVDKRFCSTLIIIVLAVMGFVGIMFLGILSARAIPEFVSFRSSTCNEIALKTMRSAKSGLDKYFSQNGRYPDTLDQILIEKDEGVKITLKKTSDRNYVLVGQHARGDKEFLAVSGKDDIFYRLKKLPKIQFVAVK